MLGSNKHTGIGTRYCFTAETAVKLTSKSEDSAVKFKENGEMFVKQKDENQIQDNLIDETIRAAFGFSEDQIQEELDEAVAHPDNSPELQVPDDEFQKIMQKIQERGIQPVPLGEGKRAHAGSDEERKSSRSHRIKKTLLIAAILSAAGVGFSLNAVGKGATKYMVVEDGSKGNNIAWSNVKGIDGINGEREAYARVKSELEMPVMKLGYVPSEMNFEKLVLNGKTGVLQFEYRGGDLFVAQSDGDAGHGIMGEGKSKTKISQIYNPWLGRELDIYQEELDNSEKRYSTDVTPNDADITYSVSGVMEETEFARIAEGLYIDSSNE